MAGAALDNINDIVSQEAFNQIEVRLPEALDAAAKKMIETAKVFKKNSLNATNATTLKDEVAQTNALTEARKKLAEVNKQVETQQKQAQTLSAKQRQDRQLEIAGAKESAAVQKAVADQQKENDRIARELTNDYGLLSKAYNDAALQAKNYSLQLGANHPVTIQATADASALGLQLRQLDASVGQNQRNVGNYASAFSGLSQAWGILRTAAYVLPGVGIAGLLGLGAEGLAEIYKAISGVDAATDSLKEYNKNLEEARKSSASELAQLILLRGELSSNVVDRKDLSQSLNGAANKFPEYLGLLDKENVSYSEINDSITKQIALIDVRTQQQAAQKTLTDATAEYGVAQDKVNRILQGNLTLWEKFRAYTIDIQLDGVTAQERELANAMDDEQAARAKVNAALDRSINPLKANLVLLIQQQAANEKEIQGYQKLLEVQGFLTQSQQKYYDEKKLLIDAANQHISSLAGEIALMKESAKRTLTNAELEALNADTQLKLLKKGTAEYVNQLKIKNDADLKAQKEALANQYKALDNDYLNNKEYQAKLANLDATAKQQLLLAQDQYTKKRTKALNQENKDDDALRKARLDAEKAYSDAVRDNQNALSEENIQTNKEIWQDDTQTLDRRIEAYNEYYAGRQRQAKANSEKELSDIKAQQAEIARIEGQDPSHISTNEKALLMKKEALAEQEKGIQYQLGADLAKIATESAKDILTIQQTYSAAQLRLFNADAAKEKDIRSQATKDQLKLLSDQAAQGLLNWNDYQKQKSNLTIEADKKDQEAIISAIYEELLTVKLSTKEEEELYKQLYAAKAKLADDDLKLQDKATEEAKRKRLATVEFEVGAIQDGLNVISGLEQQSNKASQQRTEDEKNAIDDKYDAEITAIKSSGQTQAEIDKQVADLQAKQAGEKKVLDDEQAKRNAQLAAQQKQITIMNIILTTSLAVIKAFETGLTPFDRAIAAAAAAATGAAQLAVALATPVPSYAAGTAGDTVHKGGMAQVGDYKKNGEYMAEWIKEPNKDGYWSPSTPTYMNLAQGTKVYNPEQLAKMAQNSAIKQNAYSAATPEIFAQQLVYAFERNTNELKAMRRESKSKPSVMITGIDKGFKGAAQQGNAWTEYLNGNFKA